MPRRSASPDKLTIKNLSAEDLQWLKDESDRLGCDPENLVRMMIRQRSAPAPLPPQPPNGGGYYEPRYFDDQKHASLDGSAANEIYDPSTDHGPGTINEAEPSLDALMSAGPTLLDEAPKRVYSNRTIGLKSELYQRPRTIVPFRPEPARTPYPRGGIDAYTETEFVGINPEVIGSNSMGDGRNNVMRDNLRHFGVAGTRLSRGRS